MPTDPTVQKVSPPPARKKSKSAHLELAAPPPRPARESLAKCQKWELTVAAQFSQGLFKVRAACLEDEHVIEARPAWSAIICIVGSLLPSTCMKAAAAAANSREQLGEATAPTFLADSGGVDEVSDELEPSPRRENAAHDARARARVDYAYRFHLLAPVSAGSTVCTPTVKTDASWKCRWNQEICWCSAAIVGMLALRGCV